MVRSSARLRAEMAMQASSGIRSSGSGSAYREAASVSKWDAPAYLGWRRTELARVAQERGLRLGRLDRYAKADLDALAADEELAEQLHADRLLMGHQAAAHLEIRDTDFAYLVAADLAVPHSHTSVQVTALKPAKKSLWGYGATVRTLRRALLAQGKRPAHVIDVHPGRLGQTIHGGRVVAPAEIPRLPRRPLVVSVAGAGPRRQIRDALTAMGLRELDDFVCAA